MGYVEGSLASSSLVLQAAGVDLGGVVCQLCCCLFEIPLLELGKLQI